MIPAVFSYSSLDRNNMGKKKVLDNPNYLELQRRFNFFEHRWSDGQNAYIFVNPWTGETILDTSKQLNRHLSLWKQPDQKPQQNFSTNSELYQVFYESRGLGFRKFQPYEKDKERAASHINTVARGFLARLRVQKLFTLRYYKIFDKESGYYYFVDTYTNLTQWVKPRLAHPHDIRVAPDLEKPAPIDYKGYTLGPARVKTGLGKGKEKSIKYIKPVIEVEPEPIIEPEEIEYESVSFDVLKIWMDSHAPNIRKLGNEIIENARQQIWENVLAIMEEQPESNLHLYFGLHVMAKMEVHHKDSMLEEAETYALDYCCLKLREIRGRPFGTNYSFLLLAVLENLTSMKAGRIEYFRCVNVKESEQHMHMVNKLETLTWFLNKIPVEYFTIRADKNSNSISHIAKPTRKGVEYTELILKIVGAFAHEPDLRDFVSEYASGLVIKALLVCYDEQPVVMNGLKALYNFCFRNEIGQFFVLETQACQDLLHAIRQSDLGSDYEVLYECRRVELAIEPGGFRGFVEEKMTSEIEGLKNRASRHATRATGRHTASLTPMPPP